MDEPREQAFLTRLWEIQAEHGLNDTDLARRLGVHASLLTHMKAGRKGRQLSLRFALAAVECFPVLRSFLLPDLTTISGPLTEDRGVKA